jgi:hypothetical protein
MHCSCRYEPLVKLFIRGDQKLLELFAFFFQNTKYQAISDHHVVRNLDIGTMLSYLIYILHFVINGKLSNGW